MGQRADHLLEKDVVELLPRRTAHVLGLVPDLDGIRAVRWHTGASPWIFSATPWPQRRRALRLKQGGKRWRRRAPQELRRSASATGSRPWAPTTGNTTRSRSMRALL